MRLSNLRIRWQLALAVGLPVLGMVLLIAGSLWMAGAIQAHVVLPTVDRVMQDDVERELESLVRAKVSFLAEELKDCRTPEEERAALIRATDSDRWYADDSGYYFVYDTNNVSVNNPMLTGEAKSGKDFSDETDDNGVYYIRELNEAAQDGGGFVRYEFVKNGVVKPKVSYAMPIPGHEGEYFVGAGRYVDDIEADYAAFRKEVVLAMWGYLSVLGGGAFALLVVVIPIGAAIAIGVTRRLQAGTELAQAIRQGDLSTRLDMTDRDEIGELARALDTACDALETKAGLAQAIAAGDLTRDVPLASDADRLGHALSDMVADLNLILSGVKRSSNEVAAGASQLSAASQSLAQATTEQSASVQEIKAGVEQLDQQTAKNSSSAHQVQKLANAACEAGQEGDQRMQGLVQAMDGISTAADRIRRIIKTIDDIAFQTNLLALNAAVEAARAGQHGKGFAVVAEEVRSLAGRSAKASRETADLIHQTVDQIENGNRMARDAAGVLGAIVERATEVVDIASEVAVASTEQAKHVSEVNIGLDQIDSATHQNTATSEETAAAAEEMARHSKTLDQLVARFRLREETARGVSRDRNCDVAR